MNKKVHLVLAAAGSGTRFENSIPKQFATLSHFYDSDLTLYELCLYKHKIALEDNLGKIIVVLPYDHEGTLRIHEDLTQDVMACKGGETRSESVLNGLLNLPKECANDWVMVHDAARPCVTTEEIHNLYQNISSRETPNASKGIGGALALPITDTVRRVEGDAKKAELQPNEDVSREDLWAMQTPQMFICSTLIKALENAQQKGLDLQDEVQAIRADGGQAFIVKGKATNIKVTWPEDLALVDTIIQQQLRDEAL